MGSCLPVRVGEDDYGEKAPFCLKPSYCCGAYPASNNVVVKFPAGHKSGVQPSVDVVNNFSVERTVVPDVAESRESLVQPIVKELRFFFSTLVPTRFSKCHSFAVYENPGKRCADAGLSF